MAFESLLAFPGTASRASDALGKMDQASRRFTLTGQVYNEEAFRHFLALEQKRAERLSRSFLLLLVSLKPQTERGPRLSSVAAAGVFSGLSLSVRDVDFIGWYRDGYVAAAVLTQGAEGPGPEVPRLIGERVTKAIRRQVPSGVAERLLVRVRPIRRGPKR